MLTGNEIRRKYIEFFKEKQHKHYESASLIPDDPTLLLTVAGMVPFKPYFLGQKEAPCPRIVTYQKSIRTNDLENVGRTARHHTFFEMLGNFSFGDYFREESITWSWEFITEVLGLPKEKMWISVFTTDDEAERIWIEKCNFPKERIVRMGEDENWWSAGPTGSCGPCSELHVDLGVEYGGDANSKLGDPGTDNRFIEIWNLVFTEWNRKEDGSLEPLPKKNIDTGAGLERVTAMVQGKSNNFETDLLFPILEKVGELTNTQYKDSPEKDFSLKVITDHSRAVTFMINDGIMPSYEGRGYVLRRILRRAIRHGRLLGCKELFMYKMVDKVVEIMGEAYPDLISNLDHIKKIVKTEEDSFSKTLDQGITLVNEEIKKLKDKNETKLSGDITFKLYDTFGFPFELSEEICQNEGVEVLKSEFDEKMEEQREKARSSRKIIMEKGQDSFVEEFYDKHGVTQFVGYEKLKEEGILLSIREKEDKYILIFDKTPFYAESGGQVSDRGIISSKDASYRVIDVQKQKDIYMHIAERVTGKTDTAIGDKFHLLVDKERRTSIEKNHTATHLLHKTLKDFLGAHVQQAGSVVDEDRLRFDFTHYEALTEEQIEYIEKSINSKIAEGLKMTVEEMNMDMAKEKGAVALFGDKYGDRVRVADVEGYSVELCGGTHVNNIGEIAIFNIVSESGVAAGTRRIEAQTGLNAYEGFFEYERIARAAAKTLKTDLNSLNERVENVLEQLKSSHKEIESLKEKLASYEANSLFDKIETINGVKVLIESFKGKDVDFLREIVDKTKDKFADCIVALGSDDDKAIFAIGVSKSLIGKIKAGDLAKIAAQIAGGNGGGRPDFAQAGGKSGDKVAEALMGVKEVIYNRLEKPQDYETK